MTEDLKSQEDFALHAMFSREIPPVADAGFSRAVFNRVRRSIWKRRAILTAVTAIGLVIALPAVSQLLAGLSNELVVLLGHAEKSEILGQFRILLTMLPLRELLQATSAELSGTATQADTVAWLQQNQALVVAGLMALVGLVTTQWLND